MAKINRPSLIVHITDAKSWNNAQHLGEYKADSLASQGFIHCSTPQQYVKVANHLYKGKTDLLLLSIECSKLISEVRYEAVGEEFYPHVYGPLNLDAIVKVEKLQPKPDGTFSPI